MRTITAMIATLGVLGVVIASAPARADDDDHGGGRNHEWQEHQWQEHQWRDHERREHERREHEWHAYAPPPVVYAPQSYYAPPAYYAPQPRAYYAAPGVSIGFGFR